jgi:dTDP-4-amino-4,6-dideoxygalactose transaminase
MAPETSRPFLPFALPEIGEAEIAAVVETLRSGWVTTGPRTKEFEERFAAYVGARHAIAVNSATAGLHLAMEAAGIGPGDIVITTPNTFTATAEVVRYLGADIELADIDFATMNISPVAVERLLERLKTADPQKFARVKAIVPVHFSGRACDMAAIEKIASKYGLFIIEDAAHALPTDSDGRMIGTIGRITVFSFYATKTITTGEGGMAVTDDDALAARMKVMRLHGISRDVWDRYSSSKPAWHYEVVAPGFKYNLTDIASAIGLGQLARCDEMAARRRAIAAAYIAAFQGDPRVILPAEPENGDRHAWQLFVIRLAGPDRDTFISAMTAAGVGTSVHFIPLHLHPYWRERYGLAEQDFPVAFDSFCRSVSLPIYSRMNDADVNRVIESVHQALDQAATVASATAEDTGGRR